jgi:hypothetical protein
MNLASEKRAKDARGDLANVHSEMRQQTQTHHIEAALRMRITSQTRRLMKRPS